MLHPPTQTKTTDLKEHSTAARLSISCIQETDSSITVFNIKWEQLYWEKVSDIRGRFLSRSLCRRGEEMLAGAEVGMIRFSCYCDLTWRPCLFASWVDDLVGRWDSREAERDLVERGHTGELQVSTFLCSSSDRLGVRKTTQGNIDRSGKLKNRWESSVPETQELTNYYNDNNKLVEGPSL